MNSKTNKFKLLFYSTVALSALIVILRTVSLLTVFEADIGYYKTGAVIPYIQKALALCSVIFVIIFTAGIKKQVAPQDTPAQTHVSTFATFLCGTIQISSAFLILLFQRGTVAPITVAVILGFAFAAVYFFYIALCPPEKRSPLCVIPAMLAVIGLVAIIVKVNLDMTVTLNNPNKTLIAIALSSIALYVVQELRFAVGKPMPRLYLASASISLILCSALSIPGIIGYYSNVLSGGDFLIYYMVTFGYCVYIFVRLYTYAKLCTYFGSIPSDTSAVDAE